MENTFSGFAGKVHRSDHAVRTILESKIIIIARGVYGDDLLNAVQAVYDGGIRAVEVTFEQNGDLLRTSRAVEKLCTRFGGSMTIGAGTVLTEEQVRIAYNSGAQYIVSPNTDERIIALTRELGMASIPGAMTPTEITAAASFGADIVKIFPAGVLGADYFKAVTVPLSHIRCAAVAGITLKNIADFKSAGACAFGISSSVLSNKLIAEHKFSDISKTAAAYYNAAK